MSQASKKIAIGAITGVAATALWKVVKARSRKFDFRDKTVLITGGSRGLGLVLARQFADAGARVAICARDREEIERALGDLAGSDAYAAGFIADVTDKAEVGSLIEDVRGRFGQIDVLVNNAGLIQVGPLQTQTEADFRDAMDVHLWAPYFMMSAVIPEMSRRGGGRIINISSIGGKVAVPHLAPYCTSKHALAGLSAAMSAELAGDNIFVTSVFPGLMRTGSHINAEFKGQNQKEYALFSIMDSSPLFSVSAESAARQIIHAAASGRAELIISPQAKAAAAAGSLFPELTRDILALTNRFLPGDGGIGEQTATGLESRSAASPSILTALADAASYRNNELEPNESL